MGIAMIPTRSWVARPRLSRIHCIACGSKDVESFGVPVPSAGPVDYGAVACEPCVERATYDIDLCRRIEIAAAVGTPLGEIDRVMASIGLQRVPDTLEGLDAALGLPCGAGAALARRMGVME